jgi:hypothetical protein
VKLKEIREALNKSLDIIHGLTLNGVKDSDKVDWNEVEEGRLRVTVNGEYYGVWDIARKTFVD